MGARAKLNWAYVNGALLLAAVVGVLSGSGAAFLFAAVGLLAAQIAAGNVRPWPRGR